MSDYSTFLRRKNRHLFHKVDRKAVISAYIRRIIRLMYLNCHTCYSLKYGLLTVEQLVEQAVNQGCSQLALTDINSTSCVVEFIDLCVQKGIRPKVGIEFRFKHKFYYVGLARNRKGFASLNRFLNLYLVDGIPLPSEAPELEDTFFIYDYLRPPARALRENEYVGFRPQTLNRWFRQNIFLPQQAVSLLSVTLKNPDQWESHRLLRCMESNTILSKLTDEACCHPGEYLQPPAVVRQMFAPYPFMVDNAERLLDQCSFDLNQCNPNRTRYLNDLSSDRQLLSNLARNGLAKRYGPYHAKHLPRLENELDMIDLLGFTAYFLITWDIIRFAQARNFRHVGRGSGANSLVAYCLTITDVDPVALNLYFERFINPHRPTPPDFDLDFSWDERDEVIQYVQNRFGTEQVGILASYQTFKGKSIVREIGKVLGLPSKEIDMIIRQPMAKHKHHPLSAEIFRLGKELLELPSHLSIHAGGIIVSKDPLSHFTANQSMPKGFAVTQFDMHHAATWGFHKYDILCQRGTGHIKEATKLVYERHARIVDLSDVKTITEDRKTLDLLVTPGGCIGTFYIESPAMRGLLTKVPCRNYHDLIAVSSIIRPGVAKSGMMQQYIHRFHNPGRIHHLHPIMAEILSDTFGIMVYQEDVMKVVHHLGKFDLYESDLLRRLMTGKQKSIEDLERLKDRFFDNGMYSGMNARIIKELWRQIESFSGYAFCKAHSATYAAESMQSLYLKAHYPIEFMVAVINNEGGFYPLEVYVRELIRLGGKVELPCIRFSSWLTRLEGEKVFLGLKLIKGISLETGRAILTMREKEMDITELGQLVPIITPTQLDLLIEVGALRSLCSIRTQLLFERILLTRHDSNRQMQLFGNRNYQYVAEMKDDDRMQAMIQMEHLGFTLHTPFRLFRQLPAATFELAKKYPAGSRVKIIGYYLLEKPVTTDTGKHMCFATWYDQDLEFFDTVHFPRILDRFPLQGKGFYAVEGHLEWDHGYAQVIVQACRPIALLDEVMKSPYTLSDYEYLSLNK